MSPPPEKHAELRPASGYQSVNPFNGKLLRTFEELTEPQLEAALAKAASAFELWRKTSFAERSAIAEKAATLMLAQVSEFARPLTLDMGKLSVEAKGEVALSANIIRYYSQNAEAFLKPQPLAPAAGEAMILNEPLGLIFGVQPWNFPYYQLARLAAPNLMAGNVVLVKHAGCVPQSALAFEKLWRDAGAPEGVYTNLFISHEQVNRVIDDPASRALR